MDLDLLLLPSAAAQLRGDLASLYLAASRLTPPEAREADKNLDNQAAQIDQSYYRLLRLVNNLSLTWYLEEKPLPLQDGDIVDFVAEHFAAAASLAELRGIRTRLLCAEGEHFCAFCPDALEQMFFQLLSNAMKYTPAGGQITVELRRTGGRVLLAVEDSGPGIPPEQMERLFGSPLSSQAPTLPPQGLGLGLALCQGIARGHDGTLSAECRNGTRITFSMPDRQCGTPCAEPRFDYAGGFNRALLGLADALPPEAFRIRSH